MSRDDLERRVLSVFLEVAPDVDAATVKRDVPFRDQFDFDSMDTLNFAIGLKKEFGVDVPETEYRALGSLGSAVEYVGKRLADVRRSG